MEKGMPITIKTLYELAGCEKRISAVSKERVRVLTWKIQGMVLWCWREILG
jgi:hypothetical protein